MLLNNWIVNIYTLLSVPSFSEKIAFAYVVPKEFWAQLFVIPTKYHPPFPALNLKNSQKCLPIYLQSDIREFDLQVLANANRVEIRIFCVFVLIS